MHRHFAISCKIMNFGYQLTVSTNDNVYVEQSFVPYSLGTPAVDAIVTRQQSRLKRRQLSVDDIKLLMCQSNSRAQEPYTLAMNSA